MQLLSPDVIASIEDLELAARLVVEGMRAGRHRSPFHGFSADFQQHRPYRAGDDLKYLDWKILARTDRLYSRQFRETTNMQVMLVLDSSASMAFPPQQLTKFHYAKMIAASIAYLVSTQGDAVGLMTKDGEKLAYLPARGGRVHLQALIARLSRLEPRGSWEPARTIARGGELLRRRGVVVVISDFFDAEDDTRREMRRVARRGHDVGMLQVISESELDFPYRGDVEFEDLESGERRLLDAAAASHEYRGSLRRFLDACRTEAQRDGVDYTLMPTGEPPARALRNYLLKRATGRQSGHVAQVAPR
jgi:uncharacterized protein (DUF58 family)